MRRLFAAMEAAQERLLEGAHVGLMEPRLGQWRKMALRMFEQKWASSARTGAYLDQKALTGLYIRCLAKVLEKGGIVAPLDLLPADPLVERLFAEDG